MAYAYNLALGRLRQEDHEFNANLGCIVTLCLKTPFPKVGGGTLKNTVI
jgi:hypothetical protein